jgi:hypothetical protein
VQIATLFPLTNDASKAEASTSSRAAEEIHSTGHLGDSAWITGNSKIISSPVELVPTNAHLVSASFPDEMPTY